MSYPPPPLPPSGVPPYPPSMPPPIFLPPPGRQGRSFASAIFTTLAVTLLGLSITLNIYFLFVAGLTGLAMANMPARPNVVQAGAADQQVYILDLAGIITDDTRREFERVLRQASAVPNLRALIVHIDSPGGTVTASDDLHNMLRRWRDDHDQPLIITQGGLAASGGYYISAAGDRIYASRTTLTGNIGVIMQRFNFSNLMSRWGIEDTTLVARGADFKDAGSMFRPEDPRHRAYLQELADDAFAIFKQVVQEGRGDRLLAPMSEIANGKVFTAEEALRLGLIDGTNGLEGALAYLASDHGLSNPNVVRLEQQPTLASLLGVQVGGGSAGGSSLPVQVSLPPELLETLIAPRPLFLWTGH